MHDGEEVPRYFFQTKCFGLQLPIPRKKDKEKEASIFSFRFSLSFFIQ